MSLLARSQWRYLWRHPWLLLLSLIGVAVGVAGIVAMDLAVSSCERAFRLSQETLTGRATHWIIAGRAGLDERFYKTLRVDRGLRKCAPVVEGYVSVHGQSFRLLGLDPIAEAPFRGAWLSDGQANAELAAALASPRAVAMTEGEARRLGVAVNSPLGQPPLRLKAVLTGLKPNLEQALQGQLLCDIAVAQEVLGLVGKLSRIEVILSPDEARVLASQLPTGVSLVTSSTRSRTAEQMSAAFFLNLRALSLLSLLVGGLLIYNVVHFLVLQRRPWMGQLRLLGVLPGEIRAQILAEAGWIGAWGSWLGLLLGITLSRLLLPLLTRTINDLYYNLQISQIYLSPASLLKGCLLGWCCALAAAWWPAREAAATPAVLSLQRSRQEAASLAWTGRLTWGSLVWLTLSWLVLLWAEHSLLLNLLAMAGVVLGSAALTPAAVVYLHRFLLRRLPPTHLQLKLALGGVERSLSRLGVALVAMTVALSAAISITLMVHSFRLSLLEWLQRTLAADLYVGQANRQAAKAGQGLAPDFVARLRSQPEVARVVGVKMTPVYFKVHGVTHLTQLVARDLDTREMATLRFIMGTPRPSLGPDELLATEPFLRQHRLAPGSELTLETRSGPKLYRLVGGVQDYASDSGYLLCHLPDYQERFQDPLLSGMAVTLKSRAQTDALRTRLLGWPEAARLELRSQQALRQLSVEIFEQTFQVTRLLQVLAVLVAGLGTLGAVAANQLERRREFALWQCLGMTAWERLRINWMEAALCGLWAGLAAWPCGLLQAYAMVAFINRRAFGWTLDFHVEPWGMLLTPLLGVLAATLAVALARPGRGNPAEDLRQE